MGYVHDDETGSKTWIYDHRPETTGDPLRIAGDWLAHNIEAFLFDYDHPGFQNSAYLSWCLAHFDTLRAGGVPHSLAWDPASAGVQPPMSPGRPRNAADIGIRYPDAAIEADHINTSPDVPGEAELYAPDEVSDVFMARFHPGSPTVVGKRTQAPETPAEPDYPEVTSVVLETPVAPHVEPTDDEIDAKEAAKDGDA